MKISGKTVAVFFVPALFAYAVLIIPQVQDVGAVLVSLALGFLAARRWG